MPGNGKRWQKGQSGNPKGRPKKSIAQKLNDALRKAETKHGLALLTHAVEEAYRDNHVLVAILKKLIPDQIAQQITQEGEIKVIYVAPKGKQK